MIQITKEFLEEHATNKVGWTNAQFIALGIQPRNNTNWKKKIIGTYITEQQAKAFIAGKTIKSKQDPMQQKLEF